MEDSYELTPTTDSQRTTEQPKSNTGRNIAIVVGILIFLALIGLAIYGMASNPEFTAVLRDIFIIALALVTIVIGLFLVILIFQLQSLIALLRDEIKPILESANQTASTVRGTTTFVSDSVVKPMIGVASVATGVAHAVKLLAVARGSDRRRRKVRR
ncbi:MAG TPA: hypothetical protein VLC52_13985 [Anaerolineae bacterium]|nr:hypothetical protein [Anaerolineae bacterium]